MLCCTGFFDALSSSILMATYRWLPFLSTLHFFKFACPIQTALCILLPENTFLHIVSVVIKSYKCYGSLCRQQVNLVTFGCNMAECYVLQITYNWVSIGVCVVHLLCCFLFMLLYYFSFFLVSKKAVLLANLYCLKQPGIFQCNYHRAEWSVII